MREEKLFPGKRFKNDDKCGDRLIQKLLQDRNKLKKLGNVSVCLGLFWHDDGMKMGSGETCADDQNENQGDDLCIGNESA